MGGPTLHRSALVAEAPIETLDESILDRLSWSNKVELNAVAIGPGIHDTTGKFAAVVHGDRARDTSLPHEQL